jgi:competence protein ComEC
MCAIYLMTRLLYRVRAMGNALGAAALGLLVFDPRQLELWVALLPPSAALERIIAEANALGIHVIRHWEGDECDLGGATVEVLAPPQDWMVGSKPQNNDSLVLRVSYGNSAALLEGDAQTQVERRVAALHHPTADLLRVGHHSSANATTPESLAVVKPKYAVISVGFGNSFGLPRPEILQRLLR